MDKTDTSKNAAATPEPKADANQQKDFSAVGAAMKAGSFPLAGYATYHVMDTLVRDHIIEIEKKNSEELEKPLEAYETKRKALIKEVEQGVKSAEQGLIEREKNHEGWRKILYKNLDKKGFTEDFKGFINKFNHQTRVQKQKVIIEGITIGTIIIGAIFAVANTQFFSKSQKKDDGPSR